MRISEGSCVEASPPTPNPRNLQDGLRHRGSGPCERLLRDLVRGGLSPDALPAAAGLILELDLDAAARQIETAW
jgi:hypothetical protein